MSYRWQMDPGELVCTVYGCLLFFLFLLPLLCPILSEKREEGLKLNKCIRSHSQRSPIAASMILAWFWRQSHVLEKAWTCTGTFQRLALISVSHCEGWILEPCLFCCLFFFFCRGWGCFCLCSFGVLGKFLFTLIYPQQKLAIHSFSAICALAIKILIQDKWEEMS